MSEGQKPRRLRLRRADRCATCATDLHAGTVAFWYPDAKLVRCLDCGGALGSLASTATDVQVVTTAEALPEPGRGVDDLPVDQGVAGRSAAREHERRRKRREDQARETLGGLGVAIVKLTGDPQSTRVWDRGAKGETLVARRLEKHLAHTTVQLLHDRRVPGHGAANIDHIAIGPGGVTVIDTKRYKGKVTVERVGGLLSPRREILRINGRDQTKLVDGIEKQLEYVRAVLRETGHRGVEVRGALCMADTDGLPLLGSLTVRGVLVDGAKKAAALSIWRQLATRFPCA